MHAYTHFTQVSRCGMIYLEPSMLGWKPLMQSWINTLPKTLTEEHKDLIVSLFTRMVPSCLDFVRKSGFKVQYLVDLSKPEEREGRKRGKEGKKGKGRKRKRDRRRRVCVCVLGRGGEAHDECSVSHI